MRCPFCDYRIVREDDIILGNNGEAQCIECGATLNIPKSVDKGSD